MRHLDPKQAPTGPSPRRRPSLARWSVLAAIVVVGAGALGTRLFGVPPGDVVTPTEKDARELDFRKVESLTLSPVPNDQRQSALEAMGLKNEEQYQLDIHVASAARNLDPAAPPTQARLRLVELTLWDTHSQDGDVVAVDSAGFHREVVLTNDPQRLTIPLDLSGRIRITGVRDGGGGITLGVAGATQKVLMPVMTENQTLILPGG